MILQVLDSIKTAMFFKRFKYILDSKLLGKFYAAEDYFASNEDDSRWSTRGRLENWLREFRHDPLSIEDNFI